MCAYVCVCASVRPHLHGFLVYLCVSKNNAFLATSRSKWLYSLWSHRHHHDLCSIPQGAATQSHGLNIECVSIGNHWEPSGTVGNHGFYRKRRGARRGACMGCSLHIGNCHRAAGHCWRLAGLGIEVFQGSYIGLSTSVSST